MDDMYDDKPHLLCLAFVAICAMVRCYFYFTVEAVEVGLEEYQWVQSQIDAKTLEPWQVKPVFEDGVMTMTEYRHLRNLYQVRGAEEAQRKEKALFEETKRNIVQGITQ